EGLQRGLAESNRLQDVFTSSWQCGLTGNAILERSLAQAGAEGISNPRIYSHARSHFLHEPGPLMGLPWQQTAIAGRGEGVMRGSTAYPVELRTHILVPEWGGQLVAFMLEPGAAITPRGVHYIDARPTECHIS